MVRPLGRVQVKVPGWVCWRCQPGACLAAWWRRQSGTCHALLTHMTETLIQAADRAAIYNRISHDAAGDEHGVTNQDNGAEQLCDSRGLSVVARFSDNDISASNG